MNTGGIKLLAAVIAFWVLMRAVNRDSSGRTLVDHILGQAGGANQLLPAFAPAGSARNPIITPHGPALNTGNIANAPGNETTLTTDPIPGATGGRLDQGFDVTGKTFLAPYAGRVLESEQADSGWGGGGYVAVQDAANPDRVEYFAEGISPLVTKGQLVVAGQGIGRPVINPYNGIAGNIETGPANPADPLQPLAQAVSDPAQTVQRFYAWLRGLGAPAASSTSHEGLA